MIDLNLLMENAIHAGPIVSTLGLLLTAGSTILGLKAQSDAAEDSQRLIQNAKDRNAEAARRERRQTFRDFIINAANIKAGAAARGVSQSASAVTGGLSAATSVFGARQQDITTDLNLFNRQQSIVASQQQNLSAAQGFGNLASTGQFLFGNSQQIASTAASVGPSVGSLFGSNLFGSQ